MFLDFKDENLISTVYTTYPTRSIVMPFFGVPRGGFETPLPLYDSGTNYPGQIREYTDTIGNVVSQSFYSSAKIKLLFNNALTSSEKYTINRLRNIYASSSFYKPQNYTSASIFDATTVAAQSCSIITIPSFYVGSGIKPGSFSIQTSGSNTTTIITDDGYGGLMSSSLLVGSVFYEYGMAYLGHNISPANFSGTVERIIVNFSATNNIPINMYICSAPKGMMNFSNNPSFTNLSGTRNEITTNGNYTFVSSIQLYDSDYSLIGVAKLASPILLEPDGGAQFRLKLNF